VSDTAQQTSQVCSDTKNLARYIGRPYEKVNCWDLVREFYLGEFRIELSRYHNGLTPDKYVSASLIQSNKGDFVRVDGPAEYGDLMLIKLEGIECHIGIYIGNGRFLHTLQMAGSCLDRFDKYRTRTVGFFRHRSLE
jgi:cell wall-associated NlpC family hydrolase